MLTSVLPTMVGVIKTVTTLLDHTTAAVTLGSSWMRTTMDALV